MRICVWDVSVLSARLRIKKRCLICLNLTNRLIVHWTYEQRLNTHYTRPFIISSTKNRDSNLIQAHTNTRTPKRTHTHKQTHISRAEAWLPLWYRLLLGMFYFINFKRLTVDTGQVNILHLFSINWLHITVSIGLAMSFWVSVSSVYLFYSFSKERKEE